MDRRLSNAYQWLDDRLALGEISSILFDEPIPGGARWSYVFGSALLFVSLLQAITGIFLSMYYVPSAENAHVTVEWIQKEVASGAFIRGLHHWGSSMMVVLLGVHMLQVFFWGAYKKPREVVWISGGLLMLLVLAFAFTGYLLPWDMKAYFATAVGTNVASEVPIIGSFLKAVALGGSTLGTITLSRFYTVHTMLLPAGTVLFIVLHLCAFRRAGAAGPFRRDDPRLKTVELFYPKQFFYDTVFAALIFAILATLAITRPADLEPRANAADAVYLPRPDWYFLPAFQLLKIFQGRLAIIGTVIIPGVLFSMLFLAPFLDRSPERHPFKRRIATVSMIAIIGLLGTLFFLARRDDGAFLAASELERLRSLPVEQLKELPAAEQKKREAAVARLQLDRQQAEGNEFLKKKFEPYVIGGVPQPAISAKVPPPPAQYAKCAQCHGDLGAANGDIGPDLIGVGEKYDKTQLEALVQDPESFGLFGMDPFPEDKLPPKDRSDLIDYLMSLPKKP
jgi:ubiquinol-cytochrome c reductase cytochrome b subunit